MPTRYLIADVLTQSARDCVLALLLLVSMPSALLGQSTGGISRHVTATAGGPLRGATTTLIGPAGSRQSMAREDGTFAISDLAPGQYTLITELSGFRSDRRHAC